MRRHGAPRRQAGQRQPNGRLRWEPAVDRGHETTLARRACLVGAASAHRPESAYPLGVLYLRGLLADPLPEIDDPRALARRHDDAERENTERHVAGWLYRHIHDRLWGPRTARSNLGNFGLARVALRAEPAVLARLEMLSGATVARLQRMYQARVAIVGCAGDILARDILDRIVLCEEWWAAERELPFLRRTLGRFAAIRD